jgi:hypothetical protein
VVSVVAILRKAVVAVVPSVAIATLGTVALLVIRGTVGVGSGSLAFLGMLGAGIATGHVVALLGMRRWLSRGALTNRRSMLAGTVGVLLLFALAVLGPDFLGMSEAAWRRLGPLQPFIIFGVTATCGALGAVATYFPWLRARRKTASVTELDAVDSAALLTAPGLDLNEVTRRRQEERVRPVS